MKKNMKMVYVFLLMGSFVFELSASRAALLEHVKVHLELIDGHLKIMNDLMVGVVAHVGSERDEIIQQLASQRNAFNKSVCAEIGDIASRKKNIGFYVYHAVDSDAAIKKIKEHIDDVKAHQETIKKLFDVINDAGCTRPKNGQTVPELESTVDQAMYDYIKKLIADFNQTHCAAVGFGYVPAKKDL